MSSKKDYVVGSGNVVADVKVPRSEEASAGPAPPIGRRITSMDLDVPPEVCCLRFAATKVEKTDHVGCGTTRGDMMIFDDDAGGAVVGIKLVGPGQPCQEDSRN